MAQTEQVVKIYCVNCVVYLVLVIDLNYKHTDSCMLLAEIIAVDCKILLKCLNAYYSSWNVRVTYIITQFFHLLLPTWSGSSKRIS